MKNLVVIFFCLFEQSNLLAQENWFTKFYNKNYEPTVGLLNRRTHIYGQGGTIYGLKAGLNFDKRLKNTVCISGTAFRLGNPESDYLKNTQLVYVSVAEEFRFYQYKRISAISFFNIGYGWSLWQSFNELSTQINSGVQRVAPLEMGLHGDYLINPWLSLTFGAGWRFFLYGHDPGLGGYYAKIGLGISFKQLKLALKKDNPANQ